jgi:hypothetical protein
VRIAFAALIPQFAAFTNSFAISEADFARTAAAFAGSTERKADRPDLWSTIVFSLLNSSF